MSGPGAVAEAARKLERKAEGSHPDAPDRRVPKNDEAEEEPGWLKKLMGKIDSVEGKVDSITATVDNAVKEAVEAKENVKKVEAAVSSLQADVGSMKKDASATTTEWTAWRKGVESKIAAAQFKDTDEEVAPKLTQKLNDIEKELADMKSMGKPLMEEDGGIMVVGGVGTDGDENEAMAWISRHIKSFQIGAPEDIYFKGDTFKGLLFCKFDRMETADMAIKEFKKLKPHFKVRSEVFKPWFKQDAPAMERAQVSFLLGLRWQLGEWGQSKKNFKVDEKTLTMKVNGKEVVRVSIQNDKFHVTWEDQKWTE